MLLDFISHAEIVYTFQFKKSEGYFLGMCIIRALCELEWEDAIRVG